MQVQQAPVHPMGPGPARKPKAKAKGAPVALWIVGAAAVVIALVALFVPMGSGRSYGVSYPCPSAIDSVAGVAKVANMTRSSEYAQLAAKEFAGSCPQTAAALGIGIVAAIAGLVILVTALVLTTKRAGMHKQTNGGWVAPPPRYGHHDPQAGLMAPPSHYGSVPQAPIPPVQV